MIEGNKLGKMSELDSENIPFRSTRDRVKAFFCIILNKLYPDWAIIQAKQDIAVYPDSYMVVDLRNERNMGDQEEWDADNEKIYIKGLRESTVNIQAIGDGSVEALDNLRQLLERPTIEDDFFVANIAVNDVGEVKDLTDLLDNSRYLERASVDLTISYDRLTIDSPHWFEYIGINVKLYTKSDTEKDIYIKF